MDKWHQEILKKLHKSIVDDLDVYNGVINALMSEYILQDEDLKLIEEGASKKEKAEILLHILPNRGPHAFDVFHQSLKHHYWWLSDSIDRMLKAPGTAASDNGHQCTNIPPISPLTVTRKEKVSKLKEVLEKLKPKGYIALHGMKGFGKSCLTASTLKDIKLVHTLFNNQVYWIKFGYERHIDEEILIQLNNLYHQIKQYDISSESILSTQLKERLQLFMGCYFRKEENCNALLILEDVCRKEIIDAFDFDCKTLVITTDISILHNRHLSVITLNEGFTEAETLGLFAQVLNIEISKLPIEAKLIHKECKGMPLLIAMFTAHFEQFKHDMQENSNRWKYYLDCLRKKNSRNSVMKEFLEKQEATFKMCIGQLPDEMKRRYETLAIFSEDVNIMPTTLEILWEEDNPFLVEELMLDFCHKSLAAKQWNDNLKSYIYGVHDLLLCYLRKIIPPEKLQEMHRFFVEKCRKIGGGSLSKLPEDNYTYSYIGHHLEQAQLYDEFPKLYLNFDFLQAKINNTGLSDLFIDLNKYRKYITRNNDPELTSRVDDLELFLRDNASTLAKHRNKKCLDLVQIGMNHSEDEFIRKAAREIAAKKSEHLYFSLEKKLKHADAPFSEEVPTKISVARFTDNPNEILIGGDHGNIYLWNCTNRNQQFYFGYDKYSVIKKIILSKDGRYFLSLSDDGVVKLFAHDQINDYILPNSPRQRQGNWKNVFMLNSDVDDSLMTITVHDDKISDVAFGGKDEIIVACTLKGTIQIWNRSGVMLLKEETPLSHCLENIAFTNMYRLLTLNTKEGVLVFYGLRDGHYTYISKFNWRSAVDRKLHFGSQQKYFEVLYMNEYDYSDTRSTIVIVTKKQVLFVRWYCNNEQIHSYDKMIKNEIKDNHIVYTCATMTYDEVFLILADSGGNVDVWKLKEMFEPMVTFKAHISSLDTYWMEQDGYHLVCGSENKILYTWKLEIEKTIPTVINLAFNAIMKPYGQEDIVAKETYSNTIVVLLNEKVLFESPCVSGKVEQLFLMEDGNKIVYVTDKKIISVVERDSQKCTPVFTVAKTGDVIAHVNVHNRSAVVCRDSGNQLKILDSEGIVTVVESAGYVISIHKLSENVVMTVNRDGIVKLWDIRGANWQCIVMYDCDNGMSIVSHSCLSSDNVYLAVLKENKELMLFQVEMNETEEPVQIKIEQFWPRPFQISSYGNFTCCEFSQDGQYLAVGMDNGDIIIVTMASQMEYAVNVLSYHQNPVKELHWSPTNIGFPIFISVTQEEMAVWNVSLMSFKRTQHRRSRLGVRRSISSPNFTSSPRSSIVSCSASTDLKTLSLYLGESSNGNITSESLKNFWKSKVGKHQERSELLALVPLPSSGVGKICVSEDFVKFLTVDSHGFITKYTLFNFP